MERISLGHWIGPGVRTPPCHFDGVCRCSHHVVNPLLAAGWFAGIAQAFVQRPSVADFEKLSEDVFSVKGFWHNKVTRILLVVVLANLGSSLGTFVGGADVVRLFIDNL